MMFAVAAGVVSALSVTGPLSAQAAPVRNVLSVRSEALPVVELSYRLDLDGRDTAGHYNWSGLITGATEGRAAVQLVFQKGAAPEPGLAPVETRWVVRATPDTDSFEAVLHGTIDLVSGRAHLVGVITAGAGQGRQIETNSQLFNLGPNAALSESTGTMKITGAAAGWAGANE
ncbi:MAG TPA: hypothetical protein VF252_08420 [Gemmatimonadales bacterium]